MLNIHLICVGKLKESYYADAVAEYAKRLGGFCNLTLVELPEERLPDRPSRAQIDAALEREGDLILQKIPKGSLTVALCVEGRLCSSEDLAQRLSDWMLGGRSSVTFLVGGSYGLSAAVKERAALRLSMSPMTFPHHLARVMLLEQLYRVYQIHQGSDYHK